MKVIIDHSNTDIKKLHNLSENGVIARRTIKAIFRSSEKHNDKIVFNSESTYKKFKRFEYSTLAMY